MTTLKKAAGLAAAFAIVLSGPAIAQVSEDGMGKILPIHLYACSYVDGQDEGDLDNVIERWTRYMDENNTDNYAAWTLTPYHFGPEQEFDLIWMGAYTDGNAMGAGTARWLAEGGDLREDFAEVVDCQAHIGLSSAMYKAPPDNATPASSIITMMDCELNDGKRYSDVKTAELAWAEHMGDAGSMAGTWHWFPVFGGGGLEFDYKVVNAYANYQELGADWERIANGGGREASRDIFRDVDDCDDARVYVARNRRAAQLR